jgi:hypothetical protein
VPGEQGVRGHDGAHLLQHSSTQRVRLRGQIRWSLVNGPAETRAARAVRDSPPADSQ